MARIFKCSSKGICVNYRILVFKTLDKYKDILIEVVWGAFLNANNFMAGVKREI